MTYRGSFDLEDKSNKHIPPLDMAFPSRFSTNVSDSFTWYKILVRVWSKIGMLTATGDGRGKFIRREGVIKNAKQ